jgi:hypothetical protein
MRISTDDNSKLILTTEDLKELRDFFDRHLFIPQQISTSNLNGTGAFHKLCRAIVLVTEGK